MFTPIRKRHTWKFVRPNGMINCPQKLRCYLFRCYVILCTDNQKMNYIVLHAPFPPVRLIQNFLSKCDTVKMALL